MIFLEKALLFGLIKYYKIYINYIFGNIQILFIAFQIKS